MSKIYFVSDFHLGSPNLESSKKREKKILRWLTLIENDVEELFLVGDIFDFWFEYHTVVPKGFIRFLGKIAALRDKGVQIHFFTGNHDIWMFDYFEKELGIKVHRKPLIIQRFNKHLFIAHGDGLGPKDYGYKRLKKVFTNSLCQFLFRWLHPDIGTKLASYLSRRSRNSQNQEPDYFMGPQREWLYQYCLRKAQQLPSIDFFIFGHRHLPLNIQLPTHKSRYINLGEWFSSCTFASLDENGVALQYFEHQHLQTIPVQYIESIEKQEHVSNKL